MQNLDVERYIDSIKANQNELADKLGVSQAAISKVRNGKMDIPRSWIPIIKQNYNVDITDFITNDNIASDPKPEYIKGEGMGDKLIDSIFEMIKNNEKLIDNNSKLVEINAELSHFILTKFKNNGKELNHAS
jgi:transcriptional regulator with XRE-family HTH domain